MLQNSTMSCLKVILTGCIFFALLNFNAAEHRTTKRSLFFPDKDLMFNAETLKGENLLYALCDKAKKQQEKLCSIIHEKSPHEDPSSTCNITLKVDQLNATVGKEVKVVPIGKEKAVLVWLEKVKNHKDKSKPPALTLRFAAVDLTNCNVTEAKLSYDNTNESHDTVVYDVRIIPYAKSFDVVFKNSTTCSDRVCKFSVDFDSGVVTEPQLWFSSQDINPPKIFTVARGSSSKGYLVFDYDLKKVYVHLIKPNGTSHLLKEYVPKDEVTYAHASSNDTLNFCYNEDNNVICHQYDYEGKQKNRSKHHFEREVLVLSMKSLSNGGFLLSTRVCAESCNGLKSSYHLVKVHSDGKSHGKYDVSGFVCHIGQNHVSTFMYKDSDKDYCLMLVCYDSGDGQIKTKAKGHLETTVKCLSLKDIEAKH